MGRIEQDVKRECVRLVNAGYPARWVYDHYFRERSDGGMSLRTFRRRLYDWRSRLIGSADEAVLDAGIFPGFTAHGATVQVNGEGKITQAWVKQGLDDDQYQELLDAIREDPKPIEVELPEASQHRMLEVPLFDLHFPLADHRETLAGVLEIIGRRVWEEIVFVVGQDLFHNDDLRGRTASGRQIEKVDIPEGWRMARDFYSALILWAGKHAEKVRIIYSKGNHDESLAWAFVQMLRATFPWTKIDDSTKQRKLLSWRGCFIGITHGSYIKSMPQDLRGQFTIEFPEAFANSTVREIHCGHLHHEKESDIFGVRLRRMSGGPLDEWHDDEGYVGAHKRYTVYEGVPGALRAIYYV